VSIIEVGANEALRRFHERQDDKREMLYCFVTDAMGTGELMCIAEPSNGHKLSFATVKARIRLHQEQGPEYAERCGIPATDDPHRIAKIRNVLREMRVKGRLRYHLLNRWSVAG
jgi:hypothetical protein